MRSHKFIVGFLFCLMTMLCMGQLAGPFSDWEFDLIDIDGGTIDGTTVGATSASTGAFTTLSTTSLTASGTISLPAGEIDSAELDETLIRYTTVDVNAAEIKAIRGTPHEIVAAPGAGKVLQLLGGVLILDYGSEVLAESADNLVFEYDDGSAAVCSEVIECTGFLDQSADTITNIIQVKDNIDAAADIVNKNIVLFNNGDGEFTGNASDDTVLKVMVSYRVHTTGL